MVEYISEQSTVNNEDTRTVSLGHVLLYIAMIFVISGALVSGGYFFVTVREFIAQTTLPILTTVDPSTNASVVEEDTGQDLPDITLGTGRINFLLLGIDQREDEVGQPTRTDTMIILSLDLETMTASMLSIPRDLWVTIPGYGENRINVAHYYGDYYDYPGGGPALAMKTVSQNFGITIHHYVRIDFSGFETLINAIGGVDIDVPEAIYDSSYPDDNYGTIVLNIPAGPQHMDGELALQYARTRHSTSDFDRMDRQQQLILAVRDQVLEEGVPITRIPAILSALGDSVQTDLTLQEILTLAKLAVNFDLNSINRGVIDATMTTTTFTPGGAQVEVPRWELIRAMVEELFPTDTDTSSDDAIEQASIVTEGARIEIRNGTLVDGLAEEATTLLRDSGYNVVHYENADRFDYAETLIVSRGTTPVTVQAVADELGVPSENILSDSVLTYETDILVILGRDLVTTQ